MSWRGVLLENLGFKLAALVVVAMLWISVTADERQAQPVPTALAIGVRDTAWVLMDGPEEVSTTFQGRNRELLGLLMEKPVVRVQIDSVTGESMRVPLPVDRVEYDRELGVVPSFITPSTVDLRFERRRTARVPVVADVEAIPAAGFLVLRPYAVQPESVTVRGPASWVDGLTRVTTRAVRLEDLAATVMRDIPLDLPSSVPGASAEPTAVLVTVNLDSLVMREVRLPIAAEGPGATFARVRPDSATVSLRGVAAAVERMLASLEAVRVNVPARPESAYGVTLGVPTGDDGPVAVAIEPATATVEPAS